MARKEKKYHFIYKTTNLLSGKYYIGMHSTDDLNDGYMGSGKRLRYSINKYGKQNHKVDILEFFDSRDELKKREKEIVNLNELSKEECMNIIVGGEGGATRTGMFHTKETKNKISISLIGIKFSDERRKKISESGKGKHYGNFTDEHKKKISESKKGTPSKLKNIPRSEETKLKISVANKSNPFFKLKRKPLSNDTKIKISESNKDKLNKKVIQIDKNGNEIKKWDSMNLAEKTLNISHITHVCKGERKTSGGYFWRYA
jgi:group I intron endonuclease